MKKVLMTSVVAAALALSATSCMVTGCGNIGAEERLPLQAYPLELKKDFNKVVNSTAIDVEYVQSDEVSGELACPASLVEYVSVTVDGGVLTVKLSDSLDNFERNAVNRKLNNSRLYVSSTGLERVEITGSSKFLSVSDLRVGCLYATLTGSGDLEFNGVQCDGDTSEGVVQVNVTGSGDAKFSREVKAKAVNMSVTGSGDVKCGMVTAYSFNASVTGSGDLKAESVTSPDVNLSVTGSGDLAVTDVSACEVSASVSGSGDVKVSGECDNARLEVTSSGSLKAQKLKAQDVRANVVGSGEIYCNASVKLTAGVSGSGEVRYVGNPEVSCSGKAKNVRPL